jgi:hypothetical protein
MLAGALAIIFGEYKQFPVCPGKKNNFHSAHRDIRNNRALCVVVIPVLPWAA